MAASTSQTSALRIFRPVLVSALVLMTFTASANLAKAQAGEGTVRLVPSLSTVPMSGGGFTTFIVMEDLEHVAEASVGLAAFEFTLEYDQTVVEVDSAEMGPELETTGRRFQCLPPDRDEPGMFRFGCVSLGASPDGRQGSFTLAQVRLRPVGPGSTPLLLGVQVGGPLGEEAPLDVNGGAVRVEGPLAATPLATGETEPTTSTAAEATPPFATASGTTAPAGTTTSLAETAVVGETTPLSVDARDSERPNGGQADSEAQSEDSARTEAGSPANVLVWTVVGVAGLTVVAAVALGAVLWRRRRGSEAGR